MFCRFTTREGKALIIRTEDVRALLDCNDGCNLTWLVGDEARFMTVQGTADENLARLKAEELAAIAEMQKLQPRMGDGYPVLRGRSR